MDLNFASIIISIILTIVTGFMTIATYKMVQSTNESVEEMKKTRVEANSAEVICIRSVSYLTSESDSVKMSLTKIKEELQNTNNYLKKLSVERKYD